MTFDPYGNEDIFDSREALDWVRETENALAALTLTGQDTEEAELLAAVKAFLAEVSAAWRRERAFPYSDNQEAVTFIRDTYFTDYAREYAEDIGAIERDMAWPANHIDWDAAASEIQQDYSSSELNGVTYWYR